MIKICRDSIGNRLVVPLISMMLVGLFVACDVVEEPAAPTDATVATEVSEVVLAAAATWTPAPLVATDQPEPTDPPPPTGTALPTSTSVLATETLEASPTVTVEPTATNQPPTETATSVPTSPPVAATAVPVATDEAATAVPVQPTTPAEAPPAETVLGVNVLPNPSFEEGHYNQNGVPELQLPNKWRLEWDEGPTGVGNAAWDNYVRPEVRVLSTAFLPPEEHSLYIYNGQHTVKAFKGNGAVSFRLLTDVTLEPGTYVIEAKMFADIVEKWEDRQKQYAQDPTAAEFRFHIGDGGTVWTPQNFGQINVHNFTFTIDETKTIPVGIGLRGKYAIANNGWFIDDLSLRRVE